MLIAFGPDMLTGYITVRFQSPLFEAKYVDDHLADKFGPTALVVILTAALATNIFLRLTEIEG